LGPNLDGFVTPLLPGRGPRLRRYRGARDGRLLTVKEVAEELAVCPATVYKLVSRGSLTCIRVLNAVRVRREELDGFKARSGLAT
jgi:excisionase family DNA binding protein